MTDASHPTDLYQAYENIFTPAELDAVAAHGDRLHQYVGTASAAVEPVPEAVWIYERMGGVIQAVNSEVYRFDLTGFSEPFAYMVWRGGEESGWQVDNHGQPVPRKLSAILQLTDGDSYEGCDAEFFGKRNIVTAPRKRGALLVFPSHVVHRAAPIRAGTRKALVAWASGPPYR